MSSKLSQNAITALTAAALALPGVALAESTTKAKDTKPVVEKVEIKDEIVAEAKADDTADVTSNEGGEQESSDTSQGEADSQKSAGIDRVKSITFDAKYSHYREKDRAPSDAGPVSLERYKIDVWQASVTAPIDNFEVSLGLQRDVQSGSSSAALVPAKVFALGPSHILLDSRTGSSIVDERNSASVGGSYFREDSKYSLGGYYSIEHDHRSMAVSASGQWDFNKNNTSLVASFSFAGDVIRPHQSGVTGFAQYESGKKTTSKYYIALKQDLSKYNYAQLSFEYEYQLGMLADPYKAMVIYGDARGVLPAAPFLDGALPFFGGEFPAGVTVAREKRPRYRHLFTPMVRFVQYVPCTDGSAHFDYRFSDGSWRTTSHTFELAYFQPIRTGWELSGRARYYTQDKAKFYGHAFNVTGGTAPFPALPYNGGAASTDYRLGGFGTLGFEVKLAYEFYDQAKLELQWGHTKRSTTYKLGSKDKIVHPSNQNVHANYYSASLNMQL